jgi:hypothetical protein
VFSVSTIAEFLIIALKHFLTGYTNLFTSHVYSSGKVVVCPFAHVIECLIMTKNEGPA